MSTRAAAKKSSRKKTTRGGAKKTSARKKVGTARKQSAGKTAARHSAKGLKVRMYRVGFGDFFLITVPAGRGKNSYILIDCGVFKGTTGKGDIGSIEAAVEDMYKTTGGKLALVIMTHRHADHIAGFSRAKRFKDFNASMVWMPYWEQENDAKDSPHSLQLEIDGMAKQLAMQFGARKDEAAQQALHQLWNATGIDFNATAKGEKKLSGNAAALDLLKNHLGNNGKNVEYYAGGDKPKLPPELKGLSAEILGPPPKEAKDFMKLTDLKKGIGQYLDANSEGEDGASSMQPFQSRWRAKPEGDYPEINSQEIKKLVDNSQPDMLAAAAGKIENFLNNQSLVVLFTFGGKKLLFVGDAQAGNWENWLYKTDAPDRDPTNLGNLKTESQELLQTIDFYKVGHHGSTNATPIQVVNAMTEKHSANSFVAMCSTQPKTYGNPKKDSEVPRNPLMKALGAGCALVRSDSFAITLPGETKPIPPGKLAPLPKTKVGKLNQKGLYVEYSF